MSKPKQYTSTFKGKVALEAIREEATIAQLSSKYNIPPSSIGGWKKQALENFRELFNDKAHVKQLQEQEQLIAKLYKKIGELSVENEFMKKKV